MLHRIILFAIAIVAMCGCYDSHRKPMPEGFEVHANCSIAQLSEICKGGCYNISSDMVCVGRVTSSDREGNFYRSLFVEDSTGAIELKLGIYNIEAQYPVGLLVALRLKGTAIAFADNILQLGLPPQSYDTAPREFEAQAVIDRHVVRSTTVESVEPAEYNISDLNTSLCGCFVRVGNLKHEPLDGKVEAAYLRFVDSDNNVVFAYISPYANFANSVLPTEPVSLQGILCYEAVGMGVGRQFVIKPRFEDDIATIDSSI